MPRVDTHFSTCDNLAVCDPLLNLAGKHLGENKFKYRGTTLPWGEVVHKSLLYDTNGKKLTDRKSNKIPKEELVIHGTPKPYICVGFTITGNDGNEKPQEACYMVDPMTVTKADGTPFVPLTPDPYHMKQ